MGAVYGPYEFNKKRIGNNKEHGFQYTKEI